MNTVKTDVIIPAYRPGEEFDKLLERLSAQKYPVNRIIVMNTEEKFWKKIWEEKYTLEEVNHLTKSLITGQQEDEAQSCPMQKFWFL